MRPDGSAGRAVTSGGATASTPAWSPDSKRIVFSSNQDGEVFELYTVGIDGKGMRSVTPTAGDMFEPAWSPDGSKIAFSEGGSIFRGRARRRRRREAHGQREQRLERRLESRATSGGRVLMQALRVHEGGSLVYEEVPDPEPGPWRGARRAEDERTQSA